MKNSQAEAKVAVDALDGLLQAELSCWAAFRLDGASRSAPYL